MVWPFTSSPNGGAGTVSAMAKELEQLRVLTAQLQEQLRAKSKVTSGEYLYHYSTETMKDEWELEYVVLSGTSLHFYKSSKDVMYNPQEEVPIMGCSLEWEGLTSGHYWAFSIVDPGGNPLARLAALSGGLALKWVEALAAEGCVEEASSDTSSEGGGSMSSKDSSMHGMVRRNSFEGSLPPSGGFGISGNQGKGSLQRSSSHVASAATKKKSGALDASVLKAHSEPPSQLPQVKKSGGKVEEKTKTAPMEKKDEKKEGEDKAKGETGEANPEPSVRSTRRTNKLPMSGSSPVHTAVKSSYLSSDRFWNEKHNGLYNLAAVVLVVGNFRLALENLLLYGWRYNPLAKLPGLTVSNSNIPLVSCYPALLLFSLLALAAELLGYQLLQREHRLNKALVKKNGGPLSKEQKQELSSMAYFHESCIVGFDAINAMSSLVLPCVVITKTDADPLSGFVLLVLATVMWMKLVSYHHCCWDLRQARRGGQVAGMGKAHKAGSLMPGERGSPATPTEWGALQYPENLTVKNLAYFYVAPTLVYQVNYPQTPTIRIKWIMHRVVELIFATTLVTIITKQFLEPVINSALEPMAAMNLPHVVERVLRLALPSTYVWLCFFFIVFHLWLNILAELTRYGDREFYKDWWNASTLGEYWRLWNMPVHKWMLRHVYFPSVRFGMSRFSAGVLSFFVSAVFHELLLGVPLHMLRYWVFAGMMMQVPLVALSEFVKHKIKRDDWGNIIFWVSFCILGQPTCVLIYTHDFLFKNGQQVLDV